MYSAPLLRISTMATIASMRIRLSTLLLVKQHKHDTLNLLVTKHSEFIRFPAVCTYTSRPRILLDTVHRSEFQTHRTFQRCQWSNVTSNVPQVDLDMEEEEGTAPEMDATEILQKLGPEDARKLKIIKLEFDVVEQMHGTVPEKMADENWLMALQMDSKSKRMRYYTYLRRIEMKQKAQRQKQALKQQQRAEKLEEVSEKEEEPVSKNTIFLKVYDSTIKKAGNYRLAHAMQFGQPLIFDMNYEQYMRHQDCQNLVDQLLMTYGKNREAPDPFHFMFTSLNPKGKVFSMLQKAHLTGQHFLGTMTDRSYLDLFPRERLIYLSPHSQQTLKEVKEDDVYIIGAFIDKSCHKPISLARAKEQGIRTAKFPLDDYLLWAMGSKSLTLDQVMGILLKQRRTKNWEEAFQVIPRRKLNRENC